MFKAPRFHTSPDSISSSEASAENTNSADNGPQQQSDTDSSSVSSRYSRTAPSARPARLGNALIAGLLLVSLGAGYIGGYLGSGANKNNTAVTSASISRQKQIAASEGQLISSIAKSVGPSVVSVNVVTSSAPSSDFFGFAIPSQQQQAAGTGIVISSEGVIMTNRHVVPDGVTDVSVTLEDGTKLTDVKVLGRTSSNDSLDIAFLKINNLEGHKLTPAEIGDSSKVQIGDTVVAIGNALGQFDNTVTSGIISGHGRSVVASSDGGNNADAESLDDLFQTDAAINEGNSGGPLVDTDGRVIGINTAVSGQGQNIGFAIPINDVNGLIKQVLSSGKFERPYLGVRYIRLTADSAKQYKLDVQQGAYVLPAADPSNPSILPDSPAAKADIHEGDIITEIDGTKIDENNSLTSLVGRHAVGDTVKLTVLRDGKTLTVNVKLSAMPAS
jgi:serine protease Do